MNRSSTTVRPFTPVEDAGLDNDPMTHLTRVFVYFLQNLYRNMPEGYGMRWHPEEENTELIISKEKPTLVAVERVPHITCVLGPAQWSGIGLDQMQSLRISDGSRVHTDLMPMSVSYHCQASNGLHARRIAWNSSMYTTALRRVIMRSGGLFNVGVQHSISPEGPITQFTGPTSEVELVEVVVSVPFYWQPQWRITKPSEVWQKLEMTFGAQTSPLYSAAQANALRPPMVRGVPVSTRPLDPPSPAFTQKTVVED